MFADDVAIISDTVVGFQQQLNVFHAFCTDSQLKMYLKLADDNHLQ